MSIASCRECQSVVLWRYNIADYEGQEIVDQYNLALTSWSDTKKVWSLSIIYWVVASILCVLFYPVMLSDAIARYAPMADAFAAGDWQLAFHPRFGVLFQVLAGSFAYLTRMPGDLACQVVSIAMLSFSAVPLWFLFESLFDRRTAYFCVALLLVSDDFTRYAMDALRDSGKCLAFALIGLGVVKGKAHWFAFGAFILATLVSYGFAPSAVFVLGWTVYFAYRHEWRKVCPVVFAFVGATVLLSVMVHHYTGHYLPAPHYINYLGGYL